MKSLLLFSFLLLTFPLLAQNSRYDGPGGGNNAVVAVCNSPANGVPCTNYATTYNSLGVACSNSAQDTPQPQPSNCQPTVDSKGSVGFWAPAGTYDYTVCAEGNCFGPFTVTLGTGGACAEGTCVVNAPTVDQTITGAHRLVFSDPGAGLWIKSSSPSGGFAVGDSGPGNDGSLGIDITNSNTWTGAVSANQFYGIWMNHAYNPTISQPASIWGILNNLNSANVSNANGTSLVGYESHVIANSPGALGSVQAAVYSAGVSSSGGSPSFIFGLQVHAINSGTGTSPSNQAIKVTSSGAGGASSVVTDNRGVEIDSPIVTGTLTHNYGIYIQDQGLGGAHNPDPHGIFEEGTTPNDLGGGVTKVGSLISAGQVQEVQTVYSAGGHILAVEHFNAVPTPSYIEIYPQSTDKPNEGNAAVAGTVAWAAAQLTSGGLIQVHQGSYTVATTITVSTAGTQISCDDNQSTIFTAGASFNSTMFKIGWAGAQRQGMAFTNCRLEGSSGNNSSGVLLAIRDTANVNIDRNNLNDAGTNAIVLDATASGAVYNRITNNNAAECRQECLVINGSSSDATDSIFYGNSFGGTITGDGTKPWVTVNGLGSLQFTHNHISGLTHTSCMNFTNGSQTDIVISSNEIENCPQHGLLLSGSSITVANNLFYNVGNSSANTYAAIYLQSASYVSIVGNSFRGQANTKNGVFSDQGTQYNTISGNTFSGNTGFAISMLNAFAGGNTIGQNSYQNNGGTYTLGGSHYGPSGIVLQTVPTASAIPGELGFVGMATTQLAAGTTPVITTAGTGGAVTWTYVIVPKDINGNASPAGSSGSTAVGNATLTTSNFNIITWQQVDGAYSYDVYRTAHGTTPATNGKIGNVLASSILTGSFTQNYVLNDKALAGDSATAPSANTSGSASVAGLIQSAAVVFATLPACTSGLEGTQKPVTDSSTITWGATITGSSTNHVLAYCDGTNWTVAAK